MALTNPRFAHNQRLQGAALNAPPMRRGEPDREAVAILQRALVDCGFPMPRSTRPNGSMDGSFGGETEQTVKNFQEKNGLVNRRGAADGIIGRNTMTTLDRVAPHAPASSTTPLTSTTPSGQFSTHVGEAFLRHPSVPTQNVRLRCLLYEFESGQCDILSQHEEGLRLVRNQLVGGGVNVWVGGMASRAGEGGWTDRRTGRRYNNLSLSYARAHEVKRRIEYLAPHVLNGRNSLVIAEFGSSQHTSGSENLEYYRSVLVVVSDLPRPRPPPPRPPPPRSALSTRFQIRLIFGYEGGRYWTPGVFRFGIDYDQNVRNPLPSREVRYKLVGFAGFGGGATPASGSGGGPQNRFTTNVPCTPADFEGRAELVSAGLGHILSSAELTLEPSFLGSNWTRIRNFNTGFSSGIGISAHSGSFERYNPEDDTPPWER